MNVCQPLDLPTDKEMFKFFIENDQIRSKQCDFKPGDPCMNQFPSLIHEICKFLDNNMEVPNVFLHISKGIDKI